MSTLHIDSDQTSFLDRNPGSMVQVNRVCRKLFEVASTHNIAPDADEILRRAKEADRTAAYAISCNFGSVITDEERNGWLWVAASLAHPDAVEQMTTLARVRACSAREDEAKAFNALAETWLSYIDHEAGDTAPADAEEVSTFLNAVQKPEAAKAATPPEMADAEFGLNVVPSIGDPESRDGTELRRRFGRAIGRVLPYQANLPAPGEVKAAIEARWPWAASIAGELEAQFSLLRAAKGGRVKLQPLLLVGDPGSGKTTLARWLGSYAGLHTTVIPCGGVSDAGGLAPVTRGWATARPGSLASIMLQNGICNPLVVCDEIDKSSSIGGPNGSIMGTLLSMVLATTYFDSCLQAEVDISGVTYIATANKLATVDPALLERFRVMHMPNPRPEDFEVLRDNARRSFAQENGLFEQEIPSLNGYEADFLRGFLAKKPSARTFSQAYNRMVEAKMAEVEMHSARN